MSRGRGESTNQSFDLVQTVQAAAIPRTLSTFCRVQTTSATSPRQLFAPTTGCDAPQLYSTADEPITVSCLGKRWVLVPLISRTRRASSGYAYVASGNVWNTEQLYGAFWRAAIIPVLVTEESLGLVETGAHSAQCTACSM